MSWTKTLSSVLVLKDGRRLETLNDARTFILGRFPNITHSEALAHAGALLLKAAETGEDADVETATEQIERTLKAFRLMA